MISTTVARDMLGHAYATTVAKSSCLICHCHGIQQHHLQQHHQQRQEGRQQQQALQPAPDQQPFHAVPSADKAASSYAALRDWITGHGGFIHPNLQLVDQAPTGCRGLIAAVDIEMQQLEHGPVIVIPQHLQFTEQQAIHIIQGCCGGKLAETAYQQLSQVQLLAASLAHLQSHTSSSHSQDWQPYLETLPTEPPNPWLKSAPADVSSCIQAYVDSGWLSSAAASDWLLEVPSYRQAQIVAAEEVTQLLGLSLQIDVGHVLQALGHLSSRVLTSSKGSGLVPCIDLLNHSGDSMAPMLQLLDSDDLAMTVLPIRQGEAVPLMAGEELLIAYQGGYTPLEAFLKFGFVADEWWES